MNYEEILKTRSEAGSRNGLMPYGTLQKKQIEGKYRYVLVLDAALTGQLGAVEALKGDLRICGQLKNKQQLHGVLPESGEMILELEPGSYQTMGQLLDSNPAVVAKSGFIDNVVGSLLDALEELHEHQIYHLCLAPQNVLVRKGDEMPMLLLHASPFAKTPHFLQLFSGLEDFIAPEVRDGQEMSAAGDLYSLGKLIACLYSQGELPYEYKRLVAKATSENPAERYLSAADMRADLRNLRNKKHSFFSFLAAVAVVLFCAFLYFELTPNTEDIEFVDGVPAEPEESLLDPGGFEPETDIDIWADVDSTGIDSLGEQQLMNLYMKKAEDIFRKQFTQQADRILSKVYNNDNMNASEKTFLANSNAMREDLLKAQAELAEKAGISDDKANAIGMEVIEYLIEEKQKNLSSPGFQKGTNSEE